MPPEVATPPVEDSTPWGIAAKAKEDAAASQITTPWAIAAQKAKEVEDEQPIPVPIYPEFDAPPEPSVPAPEDAVDEMFQRRRDSQITAGQPATEETPVVSGGSSFWADFRKQFTQTAVPELDYAKKAIESVSETFLRTTDMVPNEQSQFPFIDNKSPTEDVVILKLFGAGSVTLGQNIGAYFTTAFTDLSAWSELIIGFPKMLQPDDLQGGGTSRLARQAFGLERSPDQVWAMLMSPDDRLEIIENGGMTRRLREEKFDFVYRQGSELVQVTDENNFAWFVMQEGMRNLWGVEGPPEGFAEHAGATIGNLLGLVARIVAIEKGIPGGGSQKLLSPHYIRSMFVWAGEGHAAGGFDGAVHGAGLALGLGVIGGLPLKSIPKLAIESGSFVALGIATGADEVEIMTMALIPPFMKLPRVAKAMGFHTMSQVHHYYARKMRMAHTELELRRVIEEMQTFEAAAREEFGYPKEQIPTPEEMRLSLLNFMRDQKGTKAEKEVELKEFRDAMELMADNGRALRAGREIAEKISIEDLFKHEQNTQGKEGKEQYIEIDGVKIGNATLKAELNKRDILGKRAKADKARAENLIEDTDLAVGDSVKVQDGIVGEVVGSKTDINGQVWVEVAEVPKAEIVQAKSEPAKEPTGKITQDPVADPAEIKLKQQRDVIKIKMAQAQIKLNSARLEIAKKKAAGLKHKALSTLIKKLEGQLGTLNNDLKRLGVEPEKSAMADSSEPTKLESEKKALEKELAKLQDEATQVRLDIFNKVDVSASEDQLAKLEPKIDTVNKKLKELGETPTTKKTTTKKKAKKKKPAKRKTVFVLADAVSRLAPQQQVWTYAYRLPDPIPTPATQAPLPSTVRMLMYNLLDPKTYLVVVRGPEGSTYRESINWVLRRPDGSQVAVDQKMVREQVERGEIVQFGDTIWGIPHEKMYNDRINDINGRDERDTTKQSTAIAKALTEAELDVAISKNIKLHDTVLRLLSEIGQGEREGAEFQQLLKEAHNLALRYVELQGKMAVYRPVPVYGKADKPLGPYQDKPLTSKESDELANIQAKRWNSRTDKERARAQELQGKSIRAEIERRTPPETSDLSQFETSILDFISDAPASTIRMMRAAIKRFSTSTEPTLVRKRLGFVALYNKLHDSMSSNGHWSDVEHIRLEGDLLFLEHLSRVSRGSTRGFDSELLIAIGKARTHITEESRARLGIPQEPLLAFTGPGKIPQTAREILVDTLKAAKSGVIRMYHGTTTAIAEQIMKGGFEVLTLKGIKEAVYKMNGVSRKERSKFPRWLLDFIEMDIQDRGNGIPGISFAPEGVAKRWEGWGGEVAHELDKGVRIYIAAKKAGAIGSEKAFEKWYDNTSGKSFYRDLGVPEIVSADIKLSKRDQQHLIDDLESYLEEGDLYLTDVQEYGKRAGFPHESGVIGFGGTYRDLVVQPADITNIRIGFRGATPGPGAQRVPPKPVEPVVHKLRDIVTREGKSGTYQIIGMYPDGKFLVKWSRNGEHDIIAGRDLTPQVTPTAKIDRIRNVARTGVDAEAERRTEPTREGPKITRLSQLKQQLNYLRESLVRLPQIQSMRKAGTDKDLVRPAQQQAILGGNPDQLVSFAAVKRQLKARIAVLESQIKTIGTSKAGAKEGGPTVVGRTGRDSEPIVEGDIVQKRGKKLRFSLKNPKAWTYERFLEEYKLDNIVITKKVLQNAKGLSPEAIYESLIDLGHIKERVTPAAGVSGRVGGLGKTDKDVVATRVEENPLEELIRREEGAEVARVGEETSATNDEIALLREALTRLGPMDQRILELRYGLGAKNVAPKDTRTAEEVAKGVPEPKAEEVEGVGLEEAAKELGISIQEADILEHKAFFRLQQQMGVIEEGMSSANYFENLSGASLHGPGPTRGGFINLLPSQAGTFPKAIGKFVTLEAFDMGLRLRRKGGKWGEVVFQKIKDTTAETARYLGKFQRHQREGAAIINTNNSAAWEMQQRPMPVGDRALRLLPVRAGVSVLRATGIMRSRPGVKGHIPEGVAGATRKSRLENYKESVQKNKNGLPVSGTTKEGGAWTVDYIKDMVEGRIPADNKQQQEIIDVFRKGAKITGRTYESVGMTNTLTLPDGTKVVRLFKRTKGGKSFPTMMTTEFYAILMRGPNQPDKLWETNVEGLMAITGKTRGTIEKKMQKMRDTVLANDPATGYRTVGAEYAREFHRHPTSLMAPNGVRVQIMHTDPRTVHDKMYTTTATRAGFIKHIGQDGAWVKKHRAKYVKANGNPYLFDDAIRTLSDIPLRMTFLGGKKMPDSPADGYYWNGRTALAMSEVYKQFLLSGTSLIQLGEPLAFSQFGYFKLAQAMWYGIRHPKMMADTLQDMNAMTRPLVELSINREGPALINMMNQAAGGLSRLHMNRIVNEILNEGLAAAQGYLAINAMVKRGIDNQKTPNWEPRAIDYYNLHRILDFPADVTNKILAGKADSAVVHEAIRRASNFATGSIALMAEKSAMRNSSVYRATVPFTGFFSNRIKGFGKQGIGVYDTQATSNKARAAHIKKPTAETLKAMKHARRQAQTAWLSLLKFTVGSEMAGIASTFLFAVWREGLEGIPQRLREFQDDPWGFLADAFMWGTFGPVYGAMHELSWRGATSAEDSATFMRRISRFILPLSVTLDVRDAWLGLGPYRNRDSWDRADRFLKLHTPFFQTLPGHVTMGMLGLLLESPAMTNAVKAAWTWRFDEKNNALPAHGGTPASRTENDKAIGILLRKGFEKLIQGEESDMWDYFDQAEALSDNEQGPTLNPGAFLVSKIILKSTGMTDVLRQNMKDVIGQKKYDKVDRRDDVIIAILASVKDAYGANDKNRAWEIYFESQDYIDSHPILYENPVPTSP